MILDAEAAPPKPRQAFRSHTNAADNNAAEGLEPGKALLTLQ